MPEKTLEALLDHGTCPGDTVLDGRRRGAEDARRPEGGRDRRRGRRREAAGRRRRPLLEVVRRAPRDDREAPRGRGAGVERREGRGGRVILGNFDPPELTEEQIARLDELGEALPGRHPEDDDARGFGPPRRLDVLHRLRARPLGLRQLRSAGALQGGPRPRRHQPRAYLAVRLRRARAARLVRLRRCRSSASAAGARPSRGTSNGTSRASTGGPGTSGRASPPPSASRSRRD